jgi:5-deoxy-glucuronate isomerase
MTGTYHLPAGSAAEGDYALALTPELAGWTYSGMRLLELGPDGSHAFATGGAEWVVLPLAGGCLIEFEGSSFDLAGRPSVFEAVTDFAYLPIDGQARLTSAGGGRFALLSVVTDTRLEPAYVPADKVSVELRGAGVASRQVNNFCTPATFAADRMIAVEVLTPGGNWSSYPPHKHDEPREGELPLEEIYYYEIDGDPAGARGYQRVYTSGPDRRIDVLAEVASGDVVLVPYGYHGPSAAPPGYAMYYLNVMAGPTHGPERDWRFRDDPNHAWIRGTWAGLPVDPRLPMTGGSR